MGSPLRVVIPPESPGRLRRAYAWFAGLQVARTLSRLVSWRLDPVLLRLSGGRLASTLLFPCAVLETTGAKSGLPRRNAVIYFHDGDRVVLTAAHAGAARHPGWYHNVLAHPQVVYGGQPMLAAVVEDPAELARLQELGDRTFPTFRRYRADAAAFGRTVPVVVLTPADAA